MTNRRPTPPEARKVIVGVDTHKHVHVAVAIDRWGIRLRDQAFVADSGGYQALITWAETHGRIEAFGVEGTGSLSGPSPSLAAVDRRPIRRSAWTRSIVPHRSPRRPGAPAHSASLSRPPERGWPDGRPPAAATQEGPMP